ncbi:hypothetical protein CDAR_200801 [Caerostris darwini]|uniref:Uncharacterized protein n=1 Tax=Caerostris darwini TaxID=1538125 RepID=A0AAV4NYQ9_9ARAC|nr:hypothetical protein CDAR_200801 [Caerostris darwini]
MKVYKLTAVSRTSSQYRQGSRHRYPSKDVQIIRTRSPSVFRANCYPFENITLSLKDTVYSTCCPHHFSRTVWIGQTEKHKRVVPGRLIHSCVAFNTYHIIMAERYYERCYGTCVEISLQLKLPTTAIQQPLPTTALGLPATDLWTTVWVVRNYFCNREIME